MEKILTFISDFFLGWTGFFDTDLLSKAFWFLMALTAVGGVCCALLGKKSVLNRGICGTLELAVLYLAAMELYSLLPFLRNYSELPFLSVMDSWSVLISPMNLDLNVLPQILVRYLLLVFSINLADSLIVSSENIGIWFCTQLLSLVAGLMLYIVITTGISLLIPAMLGRYAILSLGGMVLLIVVYLAVAVFPENPNGEAPSQPLTRRLTTNPGGALVVISFISLGLSMVLLSVLPTFGFSVWTNEEIRSGSFLLILVLFLGVLGIFSMLFHDRRKV